MGSSKSGSQTIGYRYFMTLHMGVSRGPVDEIVEIKVGDKNAWPKPEGSTKPAVPTMTDDGVTSIKADTLFGGEKKEGGISGSLTVNMGKPTQIFPLWVKTLMGGLVPDFRGVCTLVFDGMICAMNPYPKTWKVRARRILKGWDGPVWQPTLAVINLADGKVKAMNAAHILYEAATNRDWGRGLDRAQLDDAAWLSSAQTLFNEKFGLCMRWNRQENLDKFVQEVLDHVGGTIYTDRATGLLTFKLIRDDYDPDTLPLFDKNSGLLRVEDPETASQENAVNEVIVSYHDPIKDEDGAARAQNLASIQSSGSVNSTKTSYNGLPTFELANRIAQRDLRAVSVANSRYKVYLDRRAWRVYPGAVFRISDPDKGIFNLVLRAGKVIDGSITNGEIQIESVVDVFGLPSASFGDRPDSGWVPPDPTPLPVVYRKIRETTWRDMVRFLPPAELAIFDANSGGLATMAMRPNNGALSYYIASKIGSEGFVNRATETWAPGAFLSANIGAYATSVQFFGGLDLGLVLLGTLAQIGDELIRIDDIAINPDGASGTLTIARGCVDTVPAPHLQNDPVFFIESTIGTDLREYALGETVSAKLLTITSTAVLDPALAATDAVTMRSRQNLPYPPGDVRVNGTPCFSANAIAGTMNITWAHRDRKLQADTLIAHGDPNVGPEAGTTYNLRIYAGETLLNNATGITGNSWSYTGSSYTGAITIELETQRSGKTSLQKYRFNLNRTA